MFDDFNTTVTCEDFYLGTEPESIENTCPNCGTNHSTLTDAIACGEEPFDVLNVSDFDTVTVPDTEYPW